MVLSLSVPDDVTDLKQGSLTTAKISGAMRLIRRWMDLVEIFSTQENKKRAEDIMNDLETLLDAIGGGPIEKIAGLHNSPICCLCLC
jgi:hypothetical protein